jgi:maltose O-acetyltransferase
MPGVLVGADSVVAACAVVTRSVPPDHIAKGNPARFDRRKSPSCKGNGDSSVNSDHL